MSGPVSSRGREAASQEGCEGEEGGCRGEQAGSTILNFDLDRRCPYIAVERVLELRSGLVEEELGSAWLDNHGVRSRGRFKSQVLNRVTRVEFALHDALEGFALVGAERGARRRVGLGAPVVGRIFVRVGSGPVRRGLRLRSVLGVVGDAQADIGCSGTLADVVALGDGRRPVLLVSGGALHLALDVVLADRGLVSGGRQELRAVGQLEQDHIRREDVRSQVVLKTDELLSGVHVHHSPGVDRPLDLVSRHIIEDFNCLLIAEADHLAGGSVFAGTLDEGTSGIG